MESYVAILGGDKRELILGATMSQQDLKVLYVGFDKSSKEDAFKSFTLEEILKLSSVIISPLSGIDDKGIIKAHYTDKEIKISFDDLTNINPDSLFISGCLPKYIKKYLKENKIKYIESAERDDFAYLNAIPTAEGAIQTAMINSEVILHGSKCLILGFGRCAKALAVKLSALEAKVTIAARSVSALAEAEMYGYTSMDIKKSTKELNKYDFVFNTIPTLILTEDIISKIDTKLLIIDLASKPGGVDSNATIKYSIPFIHALGLPGKVFPISAGQILSRVYLPLILNHLEKGN